MENVLCHSGMLFGSVSALGVIVASVGGLGLLAVMAVRRATRRA